MQEGESIWKFHKLMYLYDKPKQIKYEVFVNIEVGYIVVTSK